MVKKGSRFVDVGPLMVIFAVVCIDLIGFGIVLPLLPLYAQAYGASPFVIGLLAISYSATQLLFNPIWGALSDRVGRRPILLMSLTGSVLFYALFGWAPSLFWLFVARLGAGVFAANISAAMAYIADVTSVENRAKGMGLVGAAFAIGFIIGPALGGFLSQYGYAMAGYGAAALSATALAVAVFKLPESLKAKTRQRSMSISLETFWRPLRENLSKEKVGRPMVVYFLVVLAFACMQITFPLFTFEVFGFDVKENGYLFTFMGIIAVVFQGRVIGSLARRFGEGPLALLGVALGMVGLVLLPFAATLRMLLFVLTVLAVGSGLNSPTLTSLISIGAHEHEQGAVLGASRSINTLARILGPLWGGWSYGALGKQWTYWSAAGVLLVAVLYGWPLLRWRPAASVRSEPVDTLLS